MTKLEKLKELKRKEAHIAELHRGFLFARGEFDKELQEFIKDFGGDGDKVDILTMLEKAIEYTEPKRIIS